MKKTISFIIILISCSHFLTAGGPWPQPKGKGYFKLSEWWIIFDQHYTDQGLIDPNVTTEFSILRFMPNMDSLTD